MDRTIVITGASRGIGLATAEAFLAAGDQVLALYHRHSSCVEALAARYPGRAFCYGCNLSKRESIAPLAAYCRNLFPHVDILINNAGIARQQLFVDMTAEDWDEIWQLHVTAPILLTQALLPGMLRRGQGQIINISSIWGREGASCEVAYSAAKAAVIGFTQALAKEVGLMGIRVNAVAPGVIDTDMCAHLTADDRQALAEQTALGRLGTAQDVAGAIVMLASPQAAYITGAVLPVDGCFMG